MSSIIDAEAELDKIEAARSYDKQWPTHRRPKPIPERFVVKDTRQDQGTTNAAAVPAKDIRIHDDGNVLDVFSDEEDGMLAMFKAIRDMIFPPSDDAQHGGQDSNKCETRDVSLPVEKTVPKKTQVRKEERMAKWQVDVIDQFLRVWHHVEVSDAARMLATDEEDSVLAMCRNIGNSTFEELSNGSRVLSKAVLENMQVAVEAAQGMTKRAMILASDAVEPEGKDSTVNAKAVGDFSMKAMLDPEEWM